jgi:hypothetical protein
VQSCVLWKSARISAGSHCPKAYRDAVALDTGAPIIVLQVGSGLLLIPEHTWVCDLCDRIATTFTRHGVQEQDLLATLPKARERVVAHHYLRLAEQECARTRGKRV